MNSLYFKEISIEPLEIDVTAVWNGPIFVEGFDPFWIFVQGIFDLHGNGPKGRKKFQDRSRISQRASKGKKTIAQGIFTPCQKGKKKRTQGIFTPSGIQ